MPAIALTSGAYTSQSLIANAQRCRNLYVERNPAETKPNMPTTHYPRPGLGLLSNPPNPGFGRCLYTANNQDLYAVVGQMVYYIDPNFVWTQLGQLPVVANTPVYISDNGQQAIVVDGSMQGFEINFQNSRAFSQISDPNFFGSTHADFLDGFLILNKPGTNQWYSTLLYQIAFSGLSVGKKTAWPDNILSVWAIERQVYVFGPLKTEVWYNAGAVPFPFQILPGNIIEQGCAATYSVAKQDTNIYWLSQSPEGDRMVMRANSQNVAQRISTHAIEKEWRDYPTISDAIGTCYQLTGHFFYKIHFPTADKTWGYDETTQQWHEDNWIDNNGVFHRARNTFCTFAYGKNLGLDWNNGALYHIDPDATDDAGTPIVWVRSFPHIVQELKRSNITAFSADVEAGLAVTAPASVVTSSPWSGGFSLGFGPRTSTISGAQTTAQLILRISRDGGYSFGNRRVKPILQGEYRKMQRFRGNGFARDWVFELMSTAQMIGALNGAYVDVIPGQD